MDRRVATLLAMTEHHYSGIWVEACLLSILSLVRRMPPSLLECYAGRKIFLTGQTGFKGSWLALWLAEMGAHVTAFALPPEDIRGNHYTAIGLSHRITSIYGDIRDYDALYDALAGSDASIVFHLAAQPLVRYSYDAPVETYASNVMGTVHLLEAVRICPHVRAVVNVTTDKCYENLEWPWPYRETDRLGGYDPYSSSKACAEIVTSAWRRSFFGAEHAPALASARAGNVIGGGDFAADRIIPDLVEGIAKDEEIVIRSPNSVRPWQHVLDALYGYLLLGERLLSEEATAYGDAWNFSPHEDDPVRVQAIAEAFISHIGKGRTRIDPSAATVHEAAMLRLDSSKARAQLGWKPRFTAEEAVAFTAEWFKNYLESPQRAAEISAAQLGGYVERITGT